WKTTKIPRLARSGCVFSFRPVQASRVRGMSAGFCVIPYLRNAGSGSIYRRFSGEEAFDGERRQDLGETKTPRALARGWFSGCPSGLGRIVSGERGETNVGPRLSGTPSAELRGPTGNQNGLLRLFGTTVAGSC